MKRALLVLAVLAPLAFAGEAQACACCAETGTWYEAPTPFGSLERGELARLRFTTARTAATPEGAPVRTYRVAAALTGRTWRWTLGGGAVLTLRLPTSATTFATDLHDGKKGGGGGPLLYKELRIEGALAASGALRGTHYRLVLQGRGNNCLKAADFHSWHLDVSGGGERYALYGTFR